MKRHRILSTVATALLTIAGATTTVATTATPSPVESENSASSADSLFDRLLFWDAGILGSSGVDAAGADRLRLAGPFFEYAEQPGGGPVLSAPLRPFFARATAPDLDRASWDALWPLAQGKTFGAQKSARVVTAYFHDQNTADPASLYRFWIVPFWFHGRGDDGSPYAALFPLGGSIRDFLWKDRMTFALWPLWMNSQINDLTTTDILWPLISHTTTPDGHIEKFRVLPFYAHTFNRRQFDKHTVLWPIWTHARHTHPKASGTAWILFPIAGRVNLTSQKGWMILPPFFQFIRGEDLSRTFVLWPLYQRETGPYRDKLYLWPLYGRRTDGELSRRFWLWPLLINERNRWGHRQMTRWSFVPFFNNVTISRSAPATAPNPAAAAPADETAATAAETPPPPEILSRRTKLWPLGSHAFDTESRASRLRVLDLWPGPVPPPVQRSWAPFWTLLDYRTQNDSTDLDLLWGLYRQTLRPGNARSFSLFPLWKHDRDETRGARRWSFLKGLAAYDRTPDRKRLRLLWIPVWQSAAPDSTEVTPAPDTAAP